MREPGLISFKDMKIFMTDISNTKPEDSIPLFIRNREIVAEKKFPEKSLYSLVDATGARFNSKLIQTIKETASANNPYVVCTAVVGLSPLTKTIVNSIMMFTGRDIKILDDAEQGKAYLHGQYLKRKELEVVN